MESLLAEGGCEEVWENVWDSEREKSFVLGGGYGVSRGSVDCLSVGACPTRLCASQLA